MASFIRIVLVGILVCRGLLLYADDQRTQFTFDFSAGTVVQVFIHERKIKEITFNDPIPQSIDTPAIDTQKEYVYNLVVTPPKGAPISYPLQFRGGEKIRISLSAENRIEVTDAKEFESNKNRALIRLFVPNRRAIVLINGLKMEDQEGEIREFKTPVILAGQTRNYRIRLDYTDDATHRKVERDKLITVKAGDNVTLKLPDFVPELP